MAKRKSTRELHSSRNRTPDSPSRPDPSGGGETAVSNSVTRSVAGNSECAIEAQRTKLMRARAVMDCAHYVLLYDDDLAEDAQRPSFSDAIGVARDLVDEVIDTLDRVKLRAARK